MKISDAIKRIGFTVSKQNKPNQTDTDAFNVLVDFFNKQQEKTIKDNLLFAKIYAHLLDIFLVKYQDIDLANKEVNKILEDTFDYRLELILFKLRYFELKKVIPDPILTLENHKEKLSEYPKIEKEFVSALDYWDKENLISHLNLNINLSIQNFKNNV